MRSGKIDYLAIGQRLKAERIKQKITQEHLCNDLGLSVYYLSKIENGHVNITLETLAEICHYLSLDPGYVVSGTVVTQNETNSLEELQQIKQIMNLCSGEQRELILALARTVLNTKACEKES